MLSLNKYLKISKLSIACLFLFKNNVTVGQPNLIQNSSFENYSNLNCIGGPSIINNWDGLYSPDYNTTDCGNNYRGVPYNNFGVSYAKQGRAYMGFISFIKTMETKEYIYQHLTYTLKADTTYCLSFYTSRADNIPYAIKNIGAYFSSTLPSMGSFTYLSNIPQVENIATYITDTTNWIEIQGCFTALGGEQYITIGNFNSNANTDTLFVGTNSLVSGGNGYAYYYIDSVSLWQNNLPTGVNKIGMENKFSVYPNPNNGNMQFNYSITKKAEFVITDITGRIINTYILGETQRSIVIKEQELNAGVYFYSIKQNSHILKQDKIIVIR